MNVEAAEHLTTTLSWYKAEDPATKSKLFMQELADGRWAIQFNDEAPTFMTCADLMAQMPDYLRVKSPMVWVSMEMLRKRLNAPDPRTD